MDLESGRAHERASEVKALSGENISSGREKRKRSKNATERAREPFSGNRANCARGRRKNGMEMAHSDGSISFVLSRDKQGNYFRDEKLFSI